MQTGIESNRIDSSDLISSHLISSHLIFPSELGYELYVPAEQAVSVFDSLAAAAEGKEEEFGFRLAGLRALGSLRMEKAYRDYGHDVDNTDNVVEAGLAFTCDMKKEGGFVGKDAVIAYRASLKREEEEEEEEEEEDGKKTKKTKKNKKKKNKRAPGRRLVQVLVDNSSSPDVLLHHGEVVLRNGVAVSGE